MRINQRPFWNKVYIYQFLQFQRKSLEKYEEKNPITILYILKVPLHYNSAFQEYYAAANTGPLPPHIELTSNPCTHCHRGTNHCLLARLNAPEKIFNLPSIIPKPSPTTFLHLQDCPNAFL